MPLDCPCLRLMRPKLRGIYSSSSKERGFMARTHLFTFFQQLYRDFEEAEVSGKSVAAVQHARDGEHSRRDFLKTSAGVTATAVLAKPAALLAARQPRIVIIGGGIAGLNAALTLQDAGYASTIYEASSRIG